MGMKKEKIMKGLKDFKKEIFSCNISDSSYFFRYKSAGYNS